MTEEKIETIKGLCIKKPEYITAYVRGEKIGRCEKIMRKIAGIGTGRYRFLRWRLGRELYMRMFREKPRIRAREINLRGGFCVQFDLRHERTNKRAGRQKNTLWKKAIRCIHSKKRRQLQRYMRQVQEFERVWMAYDSLPK